MITAALPTYNNADIISLQLESFCAQKNAPEWELIVCEEVSGKYFGADGLGEYSERLKKVNCKRILYLSLNEWMPLGFKWLEIAKQMSPDSVGMMLCASDNYSPPTRLRDAYTALTSGADWHQTRSGYFFNILNHDAAIYDRKHAPTGLFMAIGAKKLKNISFVSQFPKKGVDSWLYALCSPKVIDEKDFEPNGVHTDGLNTISLCRRDFYKDSILFSPTDGEAVFNIFDNKTKNKLK